METFSALLALCVGNSLVTGEFPPQKSVTQSFDICFDLNKRLSKQSRGWRFETPSRSLYRHYNEQNGKLTLLCTKTQQGITSTTQQIYHGILQWENTTLNAKHLANNSYADDWQFADRITSRHSKLTIHPFIRWLFNVFIRFNHGHVVCKNVSILKWELLQIYRIYL